MADSNFALVESLLPEATHRNKRWSIRLLVGLITCFGSIVLLSSVPCTWGRERHHVASTVVASTMAVAISRRQRASGPMAAPLRQNARPLVSPQRQSWRGVQVAAVTATQHHLDTPSLPGARLQFSHVHVYCDNLKQLEEYKLLETKLNSFAESIGSLASGEGGDIIAGRKAWLDLSERHGDPITGSTDPQNFTPAGQDLVEQLLVGLGWRITGKCQTPSTQTFVLSSPDLAGVQFVMTARSGCGLSELPQVASNGKTCNQADFGHFHSSELERFRKYQNGRDGFAVLGFEVSTGEIDAIYSKYAELHPRLLRPEMPKVYGDAKVLEVFAYYLGKTGESDADLGTVLRFVEPLCKSSDFWVLPGVERVEAFFDGKSLPAYCDHWVSNVLSRTGFIDTLSDTLGFTSKVDFNAGTVAAGDAQIESTVTGNDPGLLFHDKHVGLRDQSQVYLPINNAISEVGHVHWFLEEIGQGVQHIASRVEHLPAVVQRANDYRKMTGAGLSFLSIPRSYYGTLSAMRLSKDAGIGLPVAERCVGALREANIVDSTNNVDLDATLEQVEEALPDGVSKSVAEHVLRARYGNLYSLLHDLITEETYLSIVRNNILVDVQGGDLLMQIFTSNVLQRATGEEAPFLEFIQRVCSGKLSTDQSKLRPMKPGCGGFGIRNFLTLFLSIEVSKASKEKADALIAGDQVAAQHYDQMVNTFTAQMDESNPVLTTISDSMTAEAEAMESGDVAARQHWQSEKAHAQEKLLEISAKYNIIMKSLRDQLPANRQ